jgi:hypothetical protein
MRKRFLKTYEALAIELIKVPTPVTPDLVAKGREYEQKTKQNPV